MNKDIFKKYRMAVCSEKAGDNHWFDITLLENGWNIINPPIIGGVCDTYGNYIEEEQSDKVAYEGLKECFAQDYIAYPSNIEFFFNGLHHRIMQGEYTTPEEIQQKFDELGKWIVDLNKNAPQDIEI